MTEPSDSGTPESNALLGKLFVQRFEFAKLLHSLESRLIAAQAVIHATGECCRGADPRCAAGCLQEKHVRDRYERAERAEAELAALRSALTESVRLQSHYASLLNQYDGGNRKGFADAAEWIERLAAISKGYGIQPTTKAESGGGNAD